MKNFSRGKISSQEILRNIGVYSRPMMSLHEEDDTFSLCYGDATVHQEREREREREIGEEGGDGNGRLNVVITLN